MRSFFHLLRNLTVPWDIYTWVVGAIPLVSAATAMIAGYFEGVPWPWVIMIVSVTFGATATGLLRFSEWRQRQGTADKLVFQTGRIGARASDGPTREMMVGIQLESTYDYPLECEVTRVTSQIADRVPKISSVLPQRFEVPPRGLLWFDDAIINIDPLPGGAVEGLVDFEIQYGRRGGRKYVLSGRKRLHLGFDEDAKFVGAQWTDAL